MPLYDYFDGGIEPTLEALSHNEKAKKLNRRISFVGSWLHADLDTGDTDNRYRYCTWVPRPPLSTEKGFGLYFYRPVPIAQDSQNFTFQTDFFKVNRPSIEVKPPVKTLVMDTRLEGDENVHRAMETFDETEMLYAISLAGKIINSIKKNKEPASELDAVVEMAVLNYKFDNRER